MINIKDTLVLDDDNEYVVVSKANYNNFTYYYLIDKHQNNNIKFCYEEEDSLVEVQDEELIKELIPILFDNAKDEIMDLL